MNVTVSPLFFRKSGVTAPSVKAIITKKDKLGRNLCYDDQTGKRVACGGTSKPSAKPGSKPAQKPEAKPQHKPEKPTKERVTVDIIHSEINALKSSGQVSIPKMVSLIDKAMNLTVKEMNELKTKANVKASGAKAELIKKIVQRILDSPDSQPLVRDPAAVDLGPTKDRLDKILKREESGAAPFIDMVITKLKQDKVFDEDIPAPAVFKDLRRQAMGLNPLNTKISSEQLDKALKDLGDDFGRLTAMEFNAILPLMEYPEQMKEGVSSQKDILEKRRIPKDALAKSGLGKPEPKKETPKKEPETYRLKPAEVEEKPKEFSVPSVPKLPPFADRLDRIQKREQSGAAPFIDMVITKLKQDKIVAEDLSPPEVFKDLKRQAMGESPRYFKVSVEQMVNTLRALGPDFGRLTTSEFNRILPHMNYPEQMKTGVAGPEVIKQRYIPLDVLDKVRPKKKEAA